MELTQEQKELIKQFLQQPEMIDYVTEIYCSGYQGYDIIDCVILHFLKGDK
jgi:hypothetical protein